MSGITIEVGDVIQLDPRMHTHQDGFWAGQLIIVDEVKSWGVLGHAKVPGGLAHTRVENGTFRLIGPAYWLLEEDPTP